jgi:hypothetical protein
MRRFSVISVIKPCHRPPTEADRTTHVSGARDVPRLGADCDRPSTRASAGARLPGNPVPLLGGHTAVATTVGWHSGARSLHGTRSVATSLAESRAPASSMRRTLITAGLVTAGVVTALQALAGPGHPREVAPAAESAVPPSLAVTPILTADPPRVLDPDDSPIVTLNGRHFQPGLTVTMSNSFHVFTFGARSIDALTATSLRFEGSALVEGTYELHVQNPSSLPSNSLTVVVQRKK